MKSTLKNSILFIIILLVLSACCTKNSCSKKVITQKMDQADQTVKLAFSYYDQGDFKKSGELFINVADIYKEIENKDMERRALIAAAQSQLKCDQTQEFHITVARVKILLDNKQMPPEEVRLLVNLSDQMQHRPLSYPVQRTWRAVFGY
jgi:hypothetical protein